MKTLLLILALCLCAAAQTATDPATQPLEQKSIILGSGAGFKPYQTPMKAGSSAWVEGGLQAPYGLWAFARVDMRTTDAQMMFEGCKSLHDKGNNLLMLCGGPGFGADSQNVGISFTGSGKWYFTSEALKKQHVWVTVQMGVDKQTVPAPATATLTMSPVQPAFRIGIVRRFD